MITEQDLLDIQTCGVVGKYMGNWSKLFYAIKDSILISYGMFYGYACQTWDDETIEEINDVGDHDIYATHYHILKRYFLSTQDGQFKSLEFHIPTNEYLYWINFSDIERKSPRFDELYAQVSQKFYGKKEYHYHEREVAFSALKRLVNKYGFLLRNNELHGVIFDYAPAFL